MTRSFSLSLISLRVLELIRNSLGRLFFFPSMGKGFCSGSGLESGEKWVGEWGEVKGKREGAVMEHVPCIKRHARGPFTVRPDS